MALRNSWVYRARIPRWNEAPIISPRDVARVGSVPLILDQPDKRAVGIDQGPDASAPCLELWRVKARLAFGLGSPTPLQRL
jgi:hypothetical protein